MMTVTFKYKHVSFPVKFFDGINNRVGADRTEALGQF